MPFYNREKKIEEMKIVLSGEPNFVYFVYGPINSGKTALLTTVFEDLSEDYRVFYINFRRRYVAGTNDLLQVLFDVKRGYYKEDIREVVKEFFKEGAKSVKKFKGIPIPEKLFDVIFGETKVENIFKYLEGIFEGIREEKYIPVFVLDEMQSIKEVINAAGRPVIQELFNFLVGMTKETHLCHCLCATSDCLFIEDVYSNARLEGRAEYILVDDLEKEEAFRVYEEFGFKDKGLVWDYIGGKFGDIIKLFERKRRGFKEKDALKGILEDTKGKLKWPFRLIEDGEKGEINLEDVKKVLRLFKERIEVDEEEIKERLLKFLMEENILFYNPVKSTVRAQSKLLWQAIKDI